MLQQANATLRLVLNAAVIAGASAAIISTLFVPSVRRLERTDIPIATR
ncbi:MAG TPA: hypothetical protein VFR23_00300 [Jiangellaceae bacterium]|nr:hypothetical protein [Jiangellaceae bacterium]